MDNFLLDPSLSPWTNFPMMLPPIPTFTDHLASAFEISDADGDNMAVDLYTTGKYNTSFGRVLGADLDDMAIKLYTTGKDLNSHKSRARISNEQQEFLQKLMLENINWQQRTDRFNEAFNTSITPNALQMRIVRTKKKDKAISNNNGYERARPEKRNEWNEIEVSFAFFNLSNYGILI